MGFSVSDPGKGSKTREQIVTQALHVAAYKGLGALTVGTLAEKLKMSKSGLFLHFGSKENLETAVVERAGDLFFSHVLVPIEEGDFEGIERVWALCDQWLDFVAARCQEAISLPEHSFSMPGRRDQFLDRLNE